MGSNTYIAYVAPACFLFDRSDFINGEYADVSYLYQCLALINFKFMEPVFIEKGFISKNSSSRFLGYYLRRGGLSIKHNSKLIGKIRERIMDQETLCYKDNRQAKLYQTRSTETFVL